MFTAIKNKASNVKQIYDDKVKKSVKAVLDKTTIDDKLVAGVKHVKKEYKKSMTTALSAALAFVMALYIRDVVKEWINWILEFFEIGEATGLVYQTVIALVVLTICVFGIMFLSRWKEKE